MNPRSGPPPDGNKCGRTRVDRADGILHTKKGRKRIHTLWGINTPCCPYCGTPSRWAPCTDCHASDCHYVSPSRIGLRQFLTQPLFSVAETYTSRLCLTVGYCSYCSNLILQLESNQFTIGSLCTYSPCPFGHLS